MIPNKCKSVLLLIVFLFPTMIYSYTLLFPSNEEDYKVAIDNIPTPVGGYETIMKKIVYPDMAIKTRTEGKVYVMVYLNESGSVDEVKLVRGIGAGCDEEALHVVKKAKFNIATSGGNPTKAKFALALAFKIPS